MGADPGFRMGGCKLVKIILKFIAGLNGCVLSPTLFAMFIDDLADDLKIGY